MGILVTKLKYASRSSFEGRLCVHQSEVEGVKISIFSIFAVCVRSSGPILAHVSAGGRYDV